MTRAVHGRIPLAVLLGLLSVSACAGQACDTSIRPDPATRKFHLGHYVAVGRQQQAAVLARIAAPGLAGVQLRYRWAELEPTRDSYDFSALTRDLEIVQRQGLQLVALIEDKSFENTRPTPEYLHSRYTLPNRNRGFTAVRWDPFVRERFARLLDRLGTAFDCQPGFEGIAIQESAPGLRDRDLTATGYSPEKYRDTLIATLKAADAGFPRSRVFWYMNFLPRGQAYIADVAAAVVGTGVVMGGPDVLPDRQALRTKVYPFFEQFQDRMPLFNSLQHDSYRHARAGGSGSGKYWTLEELFVFARDQLHVDYLFWEYRVWRQPPDAFAWEDARAVIARHPTFRPATPP